MSLDLDFSVNKLPVRYIQSDEGLMQVVQMLQSVKEFALDLEFDRNKFKYGFNLCLVQICDGQTIYLLDPKTIDEFDSLWEIVENPDIMKVTFSCRQDVLLLKHLGCYPQNIYDLQIAHILAGNEKMSFKNTMEAVFSIEIDKGQQVSNWHNRPLKAKQLKYAAADVAYLIPMREKLHKKLINLGRLSWIEEERQLLEEIKPKENSQPHLNIPDTGRLDFSSKHILKRIFEYRDEIAMKLDKPPARVIPNSVLIDLVSEPKETMEQWFEISGISYRVKNYKALKQIKQVLNNGKAEAVVLSQNAQADRKKGRQSSVREKIKKREEIKKVFDPIRDLLNEEIKAASTLIINNRILDQLIAGATLREVLSNYAYIEVQRAAKELNIDIERYLG